MTRLISLAVAVSLALPLAAIAEDAVKNMTKSAAAAQTMPTDVVVTEIRTQAKIVELNQKNRTVVLRTEGGKLINANVSDQVRNFDKVKVGDELVVRYQIATAIQIEPASKNAIRERVESTNVQTAQPNSLPGAEMGRRVEILANIQAINRKAKTMTLRGATRSVTVAIPDNINVNKLKVGDQVHAIITDAVMVAIEDQPA
jgi:hypothetical protein